MKKEDQLVYRQRLLDLRDRLRGDVSSMADSALHRNSLEGAEVSSMPIHMAELGSDNFEQEFTLSLVEAEEGTLGKIEAALQRTEAETFGRCTECGCVIPKTRLNAIPHTPFCIKCADLHDQNGR